LRALDGSQQNDADIGLAELEERDSSTSNDLEFVVAYRTNGNRLGTVMASD
jgi:hypothetical protein